MSRHRHCRYCRRRLLRQSPGEPGRPQPLSATRDHIIARSRGGNITVWCCNQCNHLKADMSLIEWCRFMETHPNWWERFQTRGRMLAVTKPKFPFRVARPYLCRGLAA